MPPDPLIGREFGRYQIVHRIRKGGMGVVYLAKHTMLGKPFALKVVRAESSDDDVMVERFKREAQVVASLSHPNTVMVTDFGVTHDGLLFLVMEYLDGVTCAEVLSKTGPLPPERVVHLISQVCDSLHEAHQRQLVHRDIKPNNLLLTRVADLRDVVKVIDFGLAKHTLDDSDDGEGQVTRAGLLIGTPQYMPPEQIKGQEPDHRVDIYSLGVTMYRLLTGRHPFETRDVAAMFHMHLSSPPPTPSDNAPDGAMVDFDLDDVVVRCLAKDPSDRFGSTLELKHALQACASAGQWSPEQAEVAWGEAYALVDNLDVQDLLSRPPVVQGANDGLASPAAGGPSAPGSGPISGQLSPGTLPYGARTPAPSSEVSAQGAATLCGELGSGPISAQSSFANGELMAPAGQTTSQAVHILSWSRIAVTAVLALIVAFAGATVAIQWSREAPAVSVGTPHDPQEPRPPTRSVATPVSPAAVSKPAVQGPSAAPANLDVLLHLRSNPSGATVYEDGDALGETPLTVSRRRAFEELTLAFKLKGYRRATRAVDLGAVEGDQQEMVVNLTRIPEAAARRTPKARRPASSRQKAKRPAPAAAEPPPWKRGKATGPAGPAGTSSDRFRTVD